MGVIQRAINVGNKLIKEIADRVFHHNNDAQEMETPITNSSQIDTNHMDFGDFER
jgi:hypothetical protein